MWLRRTAIVSAIAAAALSLGGARASANGGCGAPPSDGTGNIVEMTANCFEATVLHVAPGAKITWVNHDPYAHTVTGVGGSWGDFAEVTKGGSVSYRFDANGVYLYSCLIHLGMVGAVVVGDGSGDAGLAQSGVVPLSAAPTAPSTTIASATSRGSFWIWPALLAGALGISLGVALGRGRRSQPAVVEAGV